MVHNYARHLYIITTRLNSKRSSSVIHFKFVNNSAEGVSYDWFKINLAALSLNFS